MNEKKHIPDLVARHPLQSREETACSQKIHQRIVFHLVDAKCNIAHGCTFSLAWPQSFNSTCLPQTNFLKHPEKFCKQATSRRAAWRWNSRVAQAILPTPAQSSCKWVLVSSVTSPKARRSTTTSVASSANRMAHKAGKPPTNQLTLKMALGL